MFLMEGFMAQGDPPQQGYFLGVHNSVENPWISRKNWENVTSPPENDSTGMNNSESSYLGEVLSLPVMRVSIDDIIGEQNEVESEPPVVRSINEDTGECSEQYEQNDDNIFSAFNRVDSSEVLSKSSCLIQ